MKKNDKNEKKMIESFRLFLWDCFGEEFSKTFKVIAINCLQFGDTGKGKIVHLLAWLWAHIVVRATGGDNAGHTVIHEGEEMVFHLLPCGIAFDKKGVVNVIGSGTVLYPKALWDEISLLKSKGLTCNNLMVALNAKLITPDQIFRDRFGELGAGQAKIGTTGKGIGPCYTDFVARKGLILNDVLNPEIFRVKLERAMKLTQETLGMISAIGNETAKEAVKSIMFHSHLESGLYYAEDGTFNIEAIIAKYLEYGEYLRQYICDTDSFIRESVGKKNILLEGAQGYLLSVDHGTYPYVTSSDCSPAGLAKGAGLRETDINISFGIIKGFYETRVGAGPFPTEMGGEQSAAWCNGAGTREKEEAAYATASINDENEMYQGVALRRQGGEYGATTKRPRRTGWIDLPLLRYALDSGANNIILTKLDVLTGIKTIKVCYAYKYVGPDYQFGSIVIREGMTIGKAVVDPEVMKHCEALYAEFPGWTEDIRETKLVSELPANLIEILKYIFKNVHTSRPVLRIISVGPGPEETIFVGPDDLSKYPDYQTSD